MTPLRVVIVHNRYRSEMPSGENRVVEEDAQQLRADGVEVIPYVRDSDEIANWSPVGKASLAVRPVVSPFDALAFRQLLKSVRPDVVHLHNPFPIISPWVIRTAKAQRVPVVQTVHNYRHACVNGMHFRDGHACTDCVGLAVPWPAVAHGCYQGSAVASMPMAAAQVLHRPTWLSVDRYLPVGSAVAEHLRSFGIPQDRIVLRPNLVADPGEMPPPGSGVLYAGRLSDEKGIRLLLEAWTFSGLARDGHSLTIAGDGPLRGEVEAAAGSDSSIRYVGLLDQRDLRGRYAACAVVAFPSLWFEAHPLALLAANAHGRAVVACDVGSMRDHVGDEAGWRVQPTAAGFADGMTAALTDPDRLTNRSMNARASFLAASAAADRRSLREIYEELSSVPRGSVVLVGPDGSGKSAVAGALRDRAESAGVQAASAHFRPRLIGDSGEVPVAVVSNPQAQAPRTLPLAVLKTGFAWTDFMLGSLLGWRRAGRRGLLVRERPWDDQLVDPVRYRLPASVRPLVRIAGALLPRADVVVMLDGSADEIHARKPELSTEEVVRQQRVWRSIFGRSGRRQVAVNATGRSLDDTVDDVVEQWREAGRAAPSTRWYSPIGFPARLDFRVTSDPAPGPACSIYPPQRRLAQISSTWGAAAARVGVARRALPPDPPLAALAARLGVVGEPIAAMRSSAPGRWIAGFEREGRLSIVAKLGTSADEGLANEIRMLESLGAHERGFDLPDVVFGEEFDGWTVLAMRAVDAPPLTSVLPLDEVAELCAALADPATGGPVVHGDLAPWNLRRRGERIVMLDWESARFDPNPLWDLAHYVVQCGALLNTFDVDEAAQQLSGSGRVGQRLIARLGLDETDGASFVLDYLERAGPPSEPAVAEFRHSLAGRLR